MDNRRSHPHHIDCRGIALYIAQLLAYDVSCLDSKGPLICLVDINNIRFPVNNHDNIVYIVHNFLKQFILKQLFVFPRYHNFHRSCHWPHSHPKLPIDLILT